MILSHAASPRYLPVELARPESHIALVYVIAYDFRLKGLAEGNKGSECQSWHPEWSRGNDWAFLTFKWRAGGSC